MTKLYRSEYLLLLAAGILSFLPLLAGGLCNTFDGIMYPADYLAGEWETACGRWLWPLLDRLRPAYAVNPLGGLLTLAAVALAWILLADALQIESRLGRILAGTAFMVSTTVCNWLSYVYMAPTFGVSLLLAATAVWLLLRLKAGIWIRTAASAVALCLCLGLYQANISVFCLAVLLAAMREVIVGKAPGQTLRELGIAVIAFAAGCLLYKGVWLIVETVTDIHPASYKGADETLGDIIMNSPAGFAEAYRQFWGFFFADTFHHHILQRWYFFAIPLLLCLVFGGIRCYKSRRGLSAAVAATTAFLLLPLAANIHCVLAPKGDNLWLQTTAGMALLTPLLLSLIPVKKWVTPSLLALLIYGNIYCSGIDQQAMREGKAAAEAIMDGIYDRLVEEGYDDEYVLFLGQPCLNARWNCSSLWTRANTYAKFGHWTTPHEQQSTRQLYCNMGRYVRCYDDDFDRYKQMTRRSDELSMGEYPAKECIKVIDRMVGVKVSNDNYTQQLRQSPSAKPRQILRRNAAGEDTEW